MRQPVLTSEWALMLLLFTFYIRAHVHTLLDNALCYKVDTYNGFALSFSSISKEFKVN